MPGDALARKEPESYYTPDGDIAYIRIRSRRGSVRSDEQAWGLLDYDEQTGDLVGLEVWSASRVLPAELVAALPRLDGRGRVSNASQPDEQPRWPIRRSLRANSVGALTLRQPRPHIQRRRSGHERIVGAAVPLTRKQACVPFRGLDRSLCSGRRARQGGFVSDVSSAGYQRW